jgi:hypothetical protein
MQRTVLPASRRARAGRIAAHPTVHRAGPRFPYAAEGATILQLQRAVGNQAVARLIAPVLQRAAAQPGEIQRNCGRGSALFNTLFEAPTVSQGGGLAHAATVHDGQSQGDIRKGAFFAGTSVETIYGMAHAILQHAYISGTIHTSHVDPTGAFANRFVRSGTFNNQIGFSRNTGQSTATVEVVFAMRRNSEATIVTIYPV